jgi:T5SS/PEP-CTERM-associated repeat protein
VGSQIAELRNELVNDGGFKGLQSQLHSDMHANSCLASGARLSDQPTETQIPHGWDPRHSRAGLSALLASASAFTLLLPFPAANAQTVVDDGSVVTVPGNTQSPWTLTDALYVGDTGTGTLQVGSGGQVSAPSVRIGNSAGSVGAVTVS